LRRVAALDADIRCWNNSASDEKSDQQNYEQRCADHDGETIQLADCLRAGPQMLFDRLGLCPAD
jgi:hypothetical protein